MPASRTKFYLDKQNKKIAGVCAGIADYTGVDATVVRIGLVLLAISTGVGPFIVAYMIAAWMATADGDPAVRSPILGFYTLGAMAVRAQFGPAKWQRARVPDVPVIYIRAVAVREDMQGKHLGTALVVDALRRCLGIADQMGAAAAVLDVLDGGDFDRRWKFYADIGFAPLGDPDNARRVFISMATVRLNLG